MKNPHRQTLVQAHAEFAEMLYGEPTDMFRMPMGLSPAPDMEAVEEYWERELAASYGPLVAVGGGVRMMAP